MKLNDFKAFELGKAQMNAIAGGVKEFYCTGDNHQRATIMVDTLEQAQAAADASFVGGAVCEEVIKG